MHHGAFQAFLVRNDTPWSLKASVSWLIQEISDWKSSFCPGRPMVDWALTSRDCVTAGNFWFCFVHKSRRITSSENHLTRLLLLCCPLLNPNNRLHLPDGWKIQQSRDSPSYCTSVICCTETMSMWMWLLLHFWQTLSLVADVDPYGLIWTVIHALNLHIYYRLEIWAILTDVQYRQCSLAVSNTWNT